MDPFLNNYPTLYLTWQRFTLDALSDVTLPIYIGTALRNTLACAHPVDLYADNQKKKTPHISCIRSVKLITISLLIWAFSPLFGPFLEHPQSELHYTQLVIGLSSSGWAVMTWSELHYKELVITLSSQSVRLISTVELLIRLSKSELQGSVIKSS